MKDEQDDKMNGRRKADYWDSVKNIALVAGFLINAAAFAYWVGTAAKQQDINTDDIGDNRKAIKNIIEQINTKHMAKVDVKDFVDRQIEPINDKLDKIDDNVITLMRSSGVTVQEYNLKSRR